MLMCMCMLTKRAQILFEQEQWKTLMALAADERVSVSELVRKAVDRMCVEDKILTQRRKAIEWIRANRVVVGPIDYKELINDGRKY